MSRSLIQALAVLQDVWTCVYPGCGASFTAYVDLAAHMGSHYS